MRDFFVINQFERNRRRWKEGIGMQLEIGCDDAR